MVTPIGTVSRVATAVKMQTKGQGIFRGRSNSQVVFWAQSTAPLPDMRCDRGPVVKVIFWTVKNLDHGFWIQHLWE